MNFRPTEATRSRVAHRLGGWWIYPENEGIRLPKKGPVPKEMNHPSVDFQDMFGFWGDSKTLFEDDTWNLKP